MVGVECPSTFLFQEHCGLDEHRLCCCRWYCNNSSRFNDISMYEGLLRKGQQADNLSDGLTRVGATLFQEIRNAVFASVAQKAIRKVACNVFDHLLRLDLNFHLSKQTGGLTRAIDRGTKGISFLLTAILFHILPTALEISMVCGILVS
jgi:hypothetical protein